MHKSIILILFPLIHLTGLARDLGSVSSTLYFPYVEWSVRNAEWEGNPFDVESTVRFTHVESNATLQTGMFYTGDREWAFLFTGTRLGQWTFISSSLDPDLNGLTGTVVVRENPNPNAHGFLQNRNGKWGWEGTDRVISPQLVMWDYVAGDANPRHLNSVDLHSFIQEFIGDHGFAGFHLPVIAGRWFDLDASTDQVNAEMANPDPRTFEVLEKCIAEIHRAGGMVHLWMWGDHQRSQTPRSLEGGIGGKEDLRLQRYLAARLGPVPGWSLGYGFDLDEWVKADALKACRDHLHDHFGWFHFVGGRPVGPNQGIDHTEDALWNAGLDYASYEHHRPTYEVYRAAVDATPGKPVLSEDRFRIRDYESYRAKDYTPERTRRGFYHSTMAGGVANIWGIHPDLSEGGIFPNKEQLKTHDLFFHENRRFRKDLVPINPPSETPDTLVLASPHTDHMILYRETADAVQVDLSNFKRTASVVAVDTLKAYEEIRLTSLKPGSHIVQLPLKSDWVIAVGDF